MNDTEPEPTPVQKPPLDAQVRKAIVWMSVALLGIAMVMLVISLNEIMAVWFRYQYVGFARAATALVLAGVSLLVLFRLTQRKN